MHDFKQYKTAVEQLKWQLTEAYQRQLVVITGKPTWCYKLANSFINDANTLVLSKQPELSNAQWLSHTHQILGQEFTNAIYDGFSGLYPDKLAALAGTIQAGGILYLLLPELSEIASWQDPAISKVQSYGYSNQHSLFNQRFGATISSLPALHFSEKNGLTEHLYNYAKHKQVNFAPQHECVDKIVKVANGRANRPLLINADRGRGKSAALGLAAAKLADKKIIICTTQFKSTLSCFKHLAEELKVTYTAAQKKLANLYYFAPDSLLNDLPECDLLLVDEAAAIPVPLLLKMLSHYPRVVFSSTLVGYEGNGRGYTIRFSEYIKKHYKASKIISLNEPLRFAQNDPLETHIRQLLALDAQYVDATSLKLSTPVHSEITQQQLATNDTLLKQIISLLALAHYQSSVNDLRQLLDAPSQRLFISQIDNQLLGVCLITIEGGLSNELAQQVILGERRPQGHLMAQTLAQLSFNAEFLTHYSARVNRIAIAPNWHNKKLGTKLLHYCEQQIKDQCQWFGASFGATTSLFNFWKKQGFKPVKLGYQRDKSTAEHSAVVIKPLCNKPEDSSGIINRFRNEFFYNLLTHFKMLNSELVASILQSFSNQNIKKETLKQFKLQVDSHYNQFTLSPILWELIKNKPSCIADLPDSEKQLLINIVLLNLNDEYIIQQLNLSGKSELELLFKNVIHNLVRRL